jgi:glycine dehydrogenase
MQSNRLMRSSMDVTTAELAFNPISFAQRHIGPQADDVRQMLQVVRAPSLDALIDDAMPGDIRQSQPLGFGPPLSEPETFGQDACDRLSQSRDGFVIGQGYYGTHLPPVIQRNVLENPAWYTAYTPYQAEISQGRLEALLIFQTMIADLTGLEIANASLLDESTAAAEAMAMARRVSPSQASAFFVDQDCHPQTVAVIQTRAEPLGWTVIVGDPATDLDAAAVFGAILQYPGSSGSICDYRDVVNRLHATDALAIVAADPLSLTLLIPPGELGADIAIGSTQRFGVPMGYGGPHAAFIAAKSAFQRAGRIVGVSVDSRRRPAYRLALQTREQHIRREKATSNICTAQVLPAVIASMYAVYHGADGLRQIASRVALMAATLACGLQNCGWTILNSEYFDTITIDTGTESDAIFARALAHGINLRLLGSRLAISCDETTTPEIVERIWAAFGTKTSVVASNHGRSFAAVAKDVPSAVPRALRRTSRRLQPI